MAAGATLCESLVVKMLSGHLVTWWPGLTTCAFKWSRKSLLAGKAVGTLFTPFSDHSVNSSCVCASMRYGVPLLVSIGLAVVLSCCYLRAYLSVNSSNSVLG